MNCGETIPGLMSRMAAWQVLQAVAAGAYADVALERALRSHQISDLDRGLVTELAYGAIRQRQLLDGWIDFLGKVSARKQPPLLRLLLHLGLYQILLMERIPFSAAVNTSVELAKKSKLARLAPVVNAVLRAAIRFKENGKELPSPSTLEAILSQSHSIPIWLAELLIALKGQAGAFDLAKAFNKPPSLDLRVNRLRTSPERLRILFDAVEIESLPIKGCPDGLEVLNGSGDLRRWPGYKEGQWCVQDRSAQWVSPLLAPQPGDIVLDACSAPGGKATHLAELIGNKGELWAVDRSLTRLKKVVTNSSRLGSNCLQTLVADSTSLLEKKPGWEGYFQRILLDAPCSGLGTLARHPDARWRMSPSQIQELVGLQEKLLEGLLPLLSAGGRIVYSTCTIHPEENSRQIEKFMMRHPELSLVSQKQIWPDLEKPGDGFYAAVIDR